MPLPLPRSRASQVASSLFAGALLAVMASGCAASEPTAMEPTSSALSPAAATATQPTANTQLATPTEPTALATSTSALKVRVLPESVLNPIPQMTYSKIIGAAELPAEMIEAPELWEGMVTRQVGAGADVAGTVQLMRVRPNVITDKAMGKELLQYLVEDFTQTKKLTEVTIEGQNALTAENVREVGWSVTSWFDGQDVIFITIRPGLSSQKVAAAYLQAD